MKKTTFYAILAVMLMYCNFAFSQTPAWQLVTPKYGNHEAIVAGFVLNAADYGNGATDATADIQARLNALSNYTGDVNHGGGVLYLKEGHYKISGRLTIPKGITIRGDWEKPVKGQPVKGTILDAYYGQNIDLSADGTCNQSQYVSNSFISMASGAAVMDLAIWYPEQSATAPKPYPPSIQMGESGGWQAGFYNVKNVTLVNSYYGIIFISETCPTINGLYGTPLKQGVEIDHVSDIGRIENCDFSPKYWAGSGLANAPAITNTTYTNWIYNNGAGVVMRRNDWSYTTYLKVEGYNKGFYTTKSRNEEATPNGHNYGFDFKNCKYGLYFDSKAGEGCMFTEVKTAGCEFGAYFTENAGGVAQFYKWDLSATKCAIYTDKNASSKITLQESTIKAGKVLLQGGTLLAVNNDFNNPKPQIEFEANSRGDIVGNRFSQGKQIAENSVFQNIISDAAVTTKPLPAYYEFNLQFKKPSREVLYNVLNAPYSVQKGTRNAIPPADATTGIQNALNAASQAGGGIVYLPPGHYRINGQLNIPANVELKGSVDVSEFPMGPGSILEIYNTASPAVLMQANSGLRGVVFNYPTQVYCTVMPNPIEFPFTIQGRGNDIYIVNVGMRASNRGVDLASYRCDNFYIDFLTGYFFREGVNIKNSDNGVLANMQCNTIVYNSGDEGKFGEYPNSARNPCRNDANFADKDPYLYNSKNMTFLTLENVSDILLYGDFNYNSDVGFHVKSNVSGLALGFALDDDRTMLLLDGSNIHLDFINLQGVALQRGTAADGLSSYIKTTANYTADSEVNLFNSDYWGYAGESGIVLNGAGTLNMYGGNFMHSGNQSFAKVNNGHLNVVGSVVNSPNGNNPTYTGTATGNITTIGSVTKGDASVTGNTNTGQSPTASTSGALNDCNTWTATANPNPNGQNAQNIVDCNTTNTWNSGWQNATAPSGNMAVAVTVDMKTNKTFNQVVLDYGRAVNDGPETYVLEVSINSTNWTQVATGSGRNTAMTTISFPTATARYIRVTKPASNTANYWAIDNIYVVNVVTTDVNTITAVPDGTPGISEGETPVAVTGVTLGNVSVNVNATVTLSPVIAPSNATNKAVTFAIVTGGDKITLNTATGLVTGTAVGTATVKVTTADGNKTATATVTVNAAPAVQCDPIRTIRIQSFGDDYLTDNGSTLTWSATAVAASEWYEIPAEGSSTDFYYKNVSTEKYLYRANTGKVSTSCDWTPENAVLNATNAKTDYYKFRSTASTWGGRVWLVNLASADFVNLTAKGAFILSGINENHTSCGMPAYPAVVTTAIPNPDNVWHSVAIATVQASVTNPDCETIVTPPTPGDPTYPAGYPKTLAMQNPLFWQFGSPKVNAAGNLDGTTGNLYTADPSAHVWNINGTPTLFVYASHDMEQAAGCDRMDRYHVFSTTDMTNWTDYGEIIKADDVPWHNGTFVNGSKFMWAPDAAYKNGKYYFYFPHPSQNSDNGAGSWGNNWKIGVAVSDYPASDFTILPNPLNITTGFEYDPCVFVDDDGKAYLYYGGGAHPYVVKLKDNMTEIDGTPQVMEGLNNFHEGIWVHKYNGKYYLSYPDNGGGGAGNGDQLKYAVSDSPLGPWESKGAYVYATGCGTIHGSIVEYQGQWYAFYHSDYVSHNGDQGRSVHVDKLYYNPDGTIKVVNNWGAPYLGLTRTVAETANTTAIALTLQAEDFNTGEDTYGHHDTKSYTNPVTINTNYRTVTGVNIEDRNGGKTIGDIAKKEFLRYTINVAKAGLYDVDVYVASDNANGRFHLNVNGVNKTGTVSTPNTGGWGTFQKITVANVPLILGENLFEIRVEEGGFNLDRFEFRKAQPYSGTPYKTNNVPGKIEAEDYDFGGQGVAYFDSNGAQTGNQNAYRSDNPATGNVVDLETNGAGGYNICWTDGGEWAKYTLNVTQAGTYDITIRVASGNGASGSLSLSFDDVYEYPSLSTTTASWGTYTTVVLHGVELSAGKHVMTMTIGGNINVDWYQFTRTSDIVTVAEANAAEEITAYPNPTNGIVYLNTQAEIRVYDLQGILLTTARGSQVDLSAYASGLYLLQVNDKWKKIVKE
ncbi:MAG: family 43 glycosylhydrolase [Prevotellaceae bacterium]|jgi:hypothetical protein|nr:family 43 glycosylhydrolase [Prevotellaceae bacterium]